MLRIFVNNMAIKMTTYYRAEDIPDWVDDNIFHSKQFFLLYEKTIGYKPIFLTAQEDEMVVGRVLAIIKYKRFLFIPRFIKYCKLYGVGEFGDDLRYSQKVFAEVLEHLTREIIPSCFFIEFKNIANGLFAYKHFRENGYFPINWLRIKNQFSPSDDLEEHFTPSKRKQIKKALLAGVELCEATKVREMASLIKTLKRNKSIHIKEYFPNHKYLVNFNELFIKSGKAKIYLVKYHNKVIGGSICLFSNQSAYLWVSGGLKNTYRKQYPVVMAIYQALKSSKEMCYANLEFMNAGPPFGKHRYRNLLLNFGGETRSTRRWFKFKWTFLNKLFNYFYS